eukprot:169800-Rhodomonas_salina.1
MVVKVRLSSFDPQKHPVEYVQSGCGENVWFDEILGFQLSKCLNFVVLVVFFTHLGPDPPPFLVHTLLVLATRRWRRGSEILCIFAEISMRIRGLLQCDTLSN